MPAIFPRSRRCKAMHDKKVMDFNPLDLLATAAALKSNRPEDKKKNRDSVAEKNKKNLNVKFGDHRDEGKNGDLDTVMTEECKISYNSDVGNMLDEHNYGNKKLETREDYLCERSKDLQKFDKDCTTVDQNQNENFEGRIECSCQTEELGSSSEEEETKETELIRSESGAKPVSSPAIVDTPVFECDNLNNTDTKPQVKQLNEVCSINSHEINLPCELGVTVQADTSVLNKTDQGTCQSTLQPHTREVISQHSTQCELIAVDKNVLLEKAEIVIKSEESRTVETGEDKLLDCAPLPRETCDIDQCKITTDVVNCQQEQSCSPVSTQQIENNSCMGDNCALICANNASNECSIMRSLLTGHKGMLENRNSEILENTGLCIGDKMCINELNTDDSVSSLQCVVDEETLDSAADVGNNIPNNKVQHSSKQTELFSDKTKTGVVDNIPFCDKPEIDICDKDKGLVELDSIQTNRSNDDKSDNSVDTIIKEQGSSVNGVHSGVSITDEHSYAGSITLQRPSIDECLDTDTEMSSQDENTTSSNLFTSQLSEDSGLCLSSPCDESSFSEFPNSTLQVHSEMSEKLPAVSSVTLQLISPVITASQTDDSNHKFSSQKNPINKFPALKSPVAERPPSYSVATFECPVSPAVTSITAIPLQETPKKNEIGQLSPILLYHTPTKSPSPSLPNASLGSPKAGSYKIGTFGSISNSNIDDKTDIDLSKRSKVSPSVKQKSALKSPSRNVLSTSSPSLPLAWRNSLLHAKLINSSPPLMGKTNTVTTPPSNHISHDHDYCSRVFNKNIVQKETVVDSQTSTNHDFKQSSMMQTIDRLQQSLKLDDNNLCIDSSSLQTFKPASCRQRSRSILAIEDCKDLDTAAKMRITGSYQNQYVYFLNKKSRSRRRTSDSDKNVVDLSKAYKGNEIIIPHLSDADLEALKEGKSLPSFNTNFPVTSLQTSTTEMFNQPPVPSENITDEKIINTILSMENEEISSADESSANSFPGGSGSVDGLGLNSITENMSLTPEQMEVLFNAMAEVEKDLNIDSSTNAIGCDDNSVSDSTKAASILSTSDKSQNLLSSGVESISNEKTSSDESKWIDNDTIHVKKNDTSSTTAEILTNSAVPAVSDKLHLSSNTVAQESEISSRLNNVNCVFDNIDKTDLLQNEQKKPSESVNIGVVDSSLDSTSPMIVTVNMFWNDLPALMVDSNNPYIRLVDIHKQILPAKDTGILKKRCQLLNIEVKNCSEMQRYFLVQYGRAYNSKSTLIVSKDDAKDLIGYYVNPIPRPPRGDLSGLKEHRVDLERIRPQHSTPANKRSEVSKKIIKQRPSSSFDGKYTATSKVSPVKSKILPSMTRTRHKKINFLEMLRGESASELDDLTAKENSCEPVNSDLQGVKNQVNEPSSVTDVSKALEIQTKPSKESKKKTGVYNNSSVVQESVDRVPNERVELQVRTDSPHSRTSKPHKSKPGKLKLKGEKVSKLEKLQGLKRSDNSTSLLVVHRDVNSTNGHRGTFQSGKLLLHLFQNINSPCIQCVNCGGMFSLSEFQKHQHESKNSSRLVENVGERRIEPQNVNLSASEKRLWILFVKKKEYLLLNMRSKKPKLLQRGSENMNKLRESPRKRKIKQLYPIEDFSFSKKRNIDFVKSSRGTCSDGTNKVLSKSDCENVVTLQNGPELTSFTALEDLF